MLWVGLATLIMLITGAGDDTREFRHRVKLMEHSLDEVLEEGERRQAAQQALAATSRAFSDHRQRLHQIGLCVDKADANYAATAEDYRACLTKLGSVWETAATEFVAAEKSFRDALLPGEFERVQEVIAQ